MHNAASDVALQLQQLLSSCKAAGFQCSRKAMGFHKWGEVPKFGWFMLENPIKTDGYHLGVTPTLGNPHMMFIPWGI